jgi:hypothetical protein
MDCDRIMNRYLAPKFKEHLSIAIVLNSYMSVVWGNQVSVT